MTVAVDLLAYPQELSTGAKVCQGGDGETVNNTEGSQGHMCDTTCWSPWTGEDQGQQLVPHKAQPHPRDAHHPGRGHEVTLFIKSPLFWVQPWRHATQSLTQQEQS